MGNVKLLVAIDLSVPEKQALHCITHTLRTQFKQGLINSEDMYRITMHFFASVPRERVKDIQQAMKQAAAGQRTFTLVTGKPGMFGSADSAVVWVGIPGGQDELTALHDRLEKQLAKAGFLEENRPYQPHITLGREIDTSALHPTLSEFVLPSVSLTAHGLTLLESKVVDGKPVHTQLSSVAFEPIK